MFIRILNDARQGLNIHILICLKINMKLQMTPFAYLCTLLTQLFGQRKWFYVDFIVELRSLNVN